IEAISLSCALDSLTKNQDEIRNNKNDENNPEPEDEENDEENSPLIQKQIIVSPELFHTTFNINSNHNNTQKLPELGHMAQMYFGNYSPTNNFLIVKKLGITLFYLTLTIYLYGDLAIYVTAVSKSLRGT